MAIEALKQKKSTLNFKSTSIPKKNSWVKVLIGVPLIVTISLGSLMTLNAYHNSKQIDGAQKYYETLQPYNDFKQKMDSVVYNDAMFKNDLASFRLLYSNSNKRPHAAYNFLSFTDTKVYFDNDISQVKKFLSYSDGFKNDNDFTMSPKYKEQNDYKMKKFINDHEKSMAVLTTFKMFNVNILDAQPSYIRNNLQTYLKEKGLPSFSFGLTQEQNEYIKENRFDKEKMDAMQKQNDEKFINYANTASENDLRKLFKMYNSYYVLVASQHLVESTYANYSVLPEYLGEIDNKVFYKMEELRNVFTKNGQLYPLDKDKSTIDQKSQERSRSVW